MVAPRPASMSSLWRPASISVLAPNRSGRGIGTPVPSSVTRKLLAELMAVSFDRDRFVADEIAPPLEIPPVRIGKLLRRRADHAMAAFDQVLAQLLGTRRLD